MEDQKIKKYYIGLICVVLCSFLLFQAAAWFERYLYAVYDQQWYLSIHTILELLSVSMAFAIYAITFYTFDQSNKLRAMIYACTFLSVAFIDTFHFLSYKGMPLFLTESSEAKATTFWVLGRLTAAVGLLSASLAGHRTVKVSRVLFLLLTLVYVAAVLFAVTFHLDFFPPLFIEGKGLTNLKIILEYVVILIQIVTMGVYFRNFQKEKDDGGYILVIIALAISVYSDLAFTLYHSVYDTYNLLGHIYKFAAYYFLFQAKFVINVRKPYEDLHRAEQKLIAYADELEMRVAERTAEINDAKAKLEKDIDYAKNIQKALLPSGFPKIMGMEFYARYIPCEKVGGDFYNVFRLDDENLGIVIGDVSGHGVSAAMMNVFINQNINTKKEYENGRYRIFTPRGVLMNLFHVYNQMPFPDELYLVIFYGIYNIRTREFQYSSAGMNTTPIVLGKDGSVRTLKTNGFPICKFGDYFKPSYDTRTITLKSGDSLIFYTDGLVELDRDNPDLFNSESIIEFVKGMKEESAEEIGEQIIDAYHALLGDREILDDVTLLVIKTTDEH